MSITFDLLTRRGPMKCMAVTSYHPYKADGKLNPKFDQNSGLILSLKDPSSREFSRAVNHFGGMIVSMISGEMRHFAGPARVVLVPSSKAGKVSEGLSQVITYVCLRDRRLVFERNCLIRSRDVEKLATGGNRGLHVHRSSIAFRVPTEPAAFTFLVDDVTTTGNSLVACCDLIQEWDASHKVYGIVLGKTARE